MQKVRNSHNSIDLQYMSGICLSKQQMLEMPKQYSKHSLQSMSSLLFLKHLSIMPECSKSVVMQSMLLLHLEWLKMFDLFFN